MKKSVYSVLFFFIVISSQAFSQTTDKQTVRQTLLAYSAGDSSNKVLHPSQIYGRPVPSQDGGIVVLEFLGGTAGGFVGLLGSSLILSQLFPNPNSGNIAIVGIGLLLAYDLGTSGAITMIGNTNDRIKGKFGSAFLGSLAGNGASLLIAMLAGAAATGTNDDAMITVAVVSVFAAPVVGGIIGYSLSRQWDKNYLRYLNSSSSSLERKQAMYSNSFTDRVSFDGMSLFVKQNPYKIQPEAMTYMNLVNVKF